MMHARSSIHRSILAFLLFLTLMLPPFDGAQAASLSSAPMRSGGSQNGMVRIYLSSLGNPGKLDITVNGSYTINGQSTHSLASGSKVTVHFNATTGELALTHNGKTQDMGSAFKLRRHATSGENGLRIAQAASSNLYPGDLTFQVKPNGTAYKLYTIAYVYIEDYLYGVVPYEMGNSSPLEALKAQAVTARTYTLRAMQSASSRLYDVVDTTSDQVYRGTPSGNSNCKAAVDATKGIIAMNGNSLTATYYTASNGGQIESVKNLWGSSAYSYITVKDDPYDLANPDARVKSFTVNASGAQSNTTLGTLLNAKAAAQFGSGAKVTAVTAVTPHTPKYPAPSRLYTKLDFDVKVSAGGSTKTGKLTFDIFNELETPLSMSNGSMKNELWTVSKTASGFKVEARRWGHGTGMSQRGAMQMANLGYTYDQILHFYFAGCTRVQYTFTRSILSAVVPGTESEEEITLETAAPIEDGKGGAADSDLLAKVTTQSGSLNLRASASTNAKVLTAIPQNSLIRIEEKQDAWCKTTYNNHTGYVMASYLTFLEEPLATPAPAPSLPDSAITAKVSTQSGSLNLRESASTSSKVLTTIPRNQQIPIYDKGSIWCSTAYNGERGYVMTKFLTFQSDMDQTPDDQPSASLEYAKVTTKSGSLNLRQEASSSAKVLRTIPQNTIIPLYEVGSVWCRTRYDGCDGYVMTSFLTLGAEKDDAPAPEETPSTPALPVIAKAQVTTQSGSLNLRETASTSAKVLRTIPRHAEIKVHEIQVTWSHVTYQESTGYVMNSFLTFLGDANLQPEAPPVHENTPAPGTDEDEENESTAEEKLTQLSEALPAQIHSDGALNLRSAPSKDSNVLYEMPAGDFLMITAMNDTWCQVEYEGREGFCMREYLLLPDEH